MPLTDEHRELWAQAHPEGVVPTPAERREQAENLAVAAFQYACRLEGLDEPSEDELRALIAESRE